MSADTRKDGALTLVEALISVIILNLFLATVLGAFVFGKLSATTAKHRIEAFNVLRQKAEELKNTAYTSISNSTTQVTIDVGKDLVKGTADDLKGTLAVTTTDKTGYKEIAITLSWKDTGWGSGRNLQEALVTYINQWSTYSS
jgi:type II secretory pathway pseudopilin PulG